MNLISLVFALKLFSDMFYQIIFFDSVLLLVLCCIFLTYLFKYKVSLVPMDFLVIALIILVAVSLLKDLSGIADGVKIESAFLVYFLGRFYYDCFKKYTKYIYVSCNIILGLNLIWILIGFGSIQWGKAMTLKGFYFMKTDFALFLAYCLIFNLMQKDISTKKRMLIVVPTLICVLLANSRMYYLIVMVLLILYFWYKKNQSLKADGKKILTLGAAGLLALWFLNNLSKISFLQDLNLLGLNITSVADLFTNKLLNGRATIWSTVYEPFAQQSIFTQLFGAQITFASSVGIGNEHSMYLKVLLCAGYVGLLAFFLFLFCAYVSCVKAAAYDKEMAYITVMLLAMFILGGFSVTAIEKTANTWLLFFAIGATRSLVQSKIQTDKGWIMQDQKSN